MTTSARDPRGPEDLFDVLEIAAVGVAESALLNDGSCLPPTVHLISALTESPYAGYVIARPFTSGADAVEAIAALGALPAAMRAPELVVTWEHANLATALELQGGPWPSALAVLVASQDCHEVRWHPFEVQLGPTMRSGGQTLVPLWGPPRREADSELPGPIARLVAVWRAGRDPRELRWVYGQLENEGYTVHWMKKADARATAAQ